MIFFLSDAYYTEVKALMDRLPNPEVLILSIDILFQFFQKSLTDLQLKIVLLHFYHGQGFFGKVPLIYGSKLTFRPRVAQTPTKSKEAEKPLARQSDKILS